MERSKILPWKVARKLAGLSQALVSRRAQIDQSHYSKVERRHSVASPDFAASLWAVLGPPAAPMPMSEYVRDPESLSDMEDWCNDLASTLDGLDPSWSTYAIQQWFPTRRFLPAFAPDERPGLIWWYAAWSLASDVSLPDALLHLSQPTDPDLLGVFRAWVRAVAPRSQDTEGPSDSIEALAVDWAVLNAEERQAVRFLVKQLASAKRQ